MDLQALARPLGWNKKASRKLCDAVAVALSTFPLENAVAITNRAAATMIEDALGPDVADTLPQATAPEQGVEIVAFVAANLFTAARATEEAVAQLVATAAGYQARRSVSTGLPHPILDTVLASFAATPPKTNQQQWSPEVSPTHLAQPAQHKPPQHQQTRQAPAPTTRVPPPPARKDQPPPRKTRPKCNGCGHTVDSCTCGAPLDPSTGEVQRLPRERAHAASDHSSSDRSSTPNHRDDDSDARTNRTTRTTDTSRTDRTNRRPGTFKDPAVLWEPSLWENEVYQGATAQTLEHQLLQAVGAQTLPSDSFPKELCTLLAELCSQWLAEPSSTIVPEIALELLFRQRLWQTPGAEKADVDSAMRKIRAQALPEKFRKAAATLESKARKAEKTRRTTPPRRTPKPSATDQTKRAGQRDRLPKALWDTLTQDQRNLIKKRP